MKVKVLSLLTLLVAVSLLVLGCGPTAAPEPTEAPAVEAPAEEEVAEEPAVE